MNSKSHESRYVRLSSSSRNEGLVHRYQGRGTFVADKFRTAWLRLETTGIVDRIDQGNVLNIIKVDDPRNGRSSQTATASWRTTMYFCAACS